MEKNIAEGIFGKVEIDDKPKIGLEISKILAPFEYEDSVTRMFCENCEGYFELSQEIVDKLLSQVNSEYKLLQQGEYISTDGCAICRKERTEISVKKIETH